MYYKAFALPIRRLEDKVSFIFYSKTADKELYFVNDPDDLLFAQAGG
jgi:hypothetical protein